jgi:FkbM family methyltransferase
MIRDTQQLFNEGKLNKWEYIDAMYGHHQLLFEYAELLPRTNISAISIDDNKVVMTFRDSGLKFIVSEGDKRLAPLDTLNFATYEQEELQLQYMLAENCKTILDIGGNYGWYAMHMANQLPKAVVHSFEPIPFTFNHLNKNIAINSILNVKSYNIGLSEMKGSFDFYYDPKLSVNASLARVSESETLEKVVCPVDTLDEVTKTKALTPDFIKCDVEGAELFVFKGGQTALRQHTPIIFTEMLRKWTAKFSYHPNDIIDFLKQFGYACFVGSGKQLVPFGRVDEQTIETNYFFLHGAHHKEVIEKFKKK